MNSAPGFSVQLFVFSAGVVLTTSIFSCQDTSGSPVSEATEAGAGGRDDAGVGDSGGSGAGEGGATADASDGMGGGSADKDAWPPPLPFEVLPPDQRPCTYCVSQYLADSSPACQEAHKQTISVAQWAYLEYCILQSDCYDVLSKDVLACLETKCDLTDYVDWFRIYTEGVGKDCSFCVPTCQSSCPLFCEGDSKSGDTP